MKARVFIILFLLLFIAGLTCGLIKYPQLFSKKELEGPPKIRLKPEKKIDETFMVGKSQQEHITLFFDSCKNGGLETAYDLLPANFRQKVARREFIADFQDNVVTEYIFLTEREGKDEYVAIVNYTRQDGSNWSAEWTFERPEYEWLATNISVTQM